MPRLPRTAPRQAEVIAHRGASAAAPEHTFAAYDIALEQRADMLELDLRASADGETVVLHDPTLARTTGDPRHVATVTGAELVAMDAVGRPPTFGAVLARYGRRTRYLVELKDPTPALERCVAAALRDAGLCDRAVIQSFHLVSLRRIRRLEPALPIAPLIAAWPAAPEAFLDGLAACGTAAIGVRHDLLDRDLIRGAQERGLGVRAWTVNEAPAAERLIGLGVDGLITDVPGEIAADAT
jgi:glycerophosphoryl diester phosphodiesterase